MLIEIENRGKNWEVSVDGGLLYHSESLFEVLRYLQRNSEDIEEGNI
ncbi:MAG: hypothetical protein Q4A56_01830 [Porphyromonadaceae bacterium]|nr:hypothetical protein [Porphyromonadaceae bacterium]